MIRAALALVALFASQPADPPAVEDGVYVLRFEGEGRKFRLHEGYDGVLGRRLAAGTGTGVSLKSVSNDNTRYDFQLRGLGPFPDGRPDGQVALAVGGQVFHLGLSDKLAPDNTAGARTNVYSAAAARALAARYNLSPELRKHPGHRVEARWVPTAPEFRAGGPVVLRLELKNTGTVPVRFLFGGKQRGPRDNQFRFIAQVGADGKGLPDTGDATNFGGISSARTLHQRETFKAEVDVSKWFTFAAGTYRVTGVLELPILDPDDDSWRPVWDDLAVGECDVRVVARKE